MGPGAGSRAGQGTTSTTVNIKITKIGKGQGMGPIELRSLSERRASAGGVPFVGAVHIDPITGDTVWKIKGTIYPPCSQCIGYPCECGTGGEGC
jgi:hypothetical protein